MSNLSSLDRLNKIPLLNMAWTRSTGLYNTVKGTDGILGRAVSAAEAVATKAVERAVPIVTPIAKKLENPIRTVDQLLCKGIDIVETKMPIVKEQPEQIYKTAKTYVSSAKEFGSSKVESLKEISRSKGNDILATRYGNVAYHGLQTVGKIAENCIDYFLPAAEEEPAEKIETSPQTDKVQHTVSTISHLSNKLRNRLYTTLSNQAKKLHKYRVDYVSSLGSMLRYENYFALRNAEEEEEPVKEDKATTTS